MRWDARNFGFDTKETYRPSEQFYLEEHALMIVDRMRDNPVLYAKTFARQKFCLGGYGIIKCSRYWKAVTIISK